MKKVLLASTALAMTAGMAAADVTLSGYAEIGVADNGDEVVFHDDLDIKFTLSGETDGGLQFGATIDLDEVGDDADAIGDGIDAQNPNGSATEEHSVFVSGDFGTITMGDTDGAFDWAMAEVFFGTSIADDHSCHIGGDCGLAGNAGLDGSANGQVARYDYSFGDFGFAVSAEIGDGTTDAEAYGVGLKYSLDLGGTGLNFGVGYQDGENAAGDDEDIVGVSLGAEIGAFQARANWADGELGGDDADYWALGVAYISGPLLIEANYGTVDAPGEGLEGDGYGVALNYDIGGGAVVMVGYGNSDPDDGDSVDTWSAGLGLSF